MALTTLTSVDKYLSTTYRPDCDYVDGMVLERNLGEWNHSRLQMLLLRYLSNREAEWGILVAPEQRVHVSPTRFRIPDGCVLLGTEPDGQIIRRPPFLCIEILSKDDSMTQMQERIRDYLAFGVQYVWVLDPRTHRAYHFTQSGMTEVKDGVLSTASPHIQVPLSEIFASDLPVQL